MYTLIHIDSETNVVIAYDHVYADSPNEALGKRPEGWTRRTTRAYKGLLAYSLG